MTPLFRLYWCSTVSGDHDYWVVAPNAKHARCFFASENQYSPDHVKAVSALRIPASDPVLAGNEYAVLIPLRPDLERWGVHFNENFHVFYYNGRVFRPESLVRDLLRAMPRPDARTRAKMQPR